MLGQDRIIEIVTKAARRHLPPRLVERVFYEKTADSQGEEALRITIVIPEGAAKKIPENAVLDTLVEIQDRLGNAGETRYPIVEYATEGELAGDGAQS